MTLFSLEGINRANAVVNFKELVAPPLSPPVVAPPLSRPGEPAPSAVEGADRVGLSSEEMFDPKAIWLNAEHIRALPVEELSERLLPVVRDAGFDVCAGADAAHHAARSRAHQAAARRR